MKGPSFNRSCATVAAIVLAFVLPATGKAQSDGDWAVLLRHDAGRVELEKSSPSKGEHGGVQAVVMTVFTRPQKTKAGKPFQTSSEMIEWDCGSRRLWVHATAHAIAGEKVDEYRIPNAAATPFPATSTIAGATARAMCTLFPQNGTTEKTSATPSTHDQWETLLRRPDVQVDLNVSSIERGRNGGIQAYILTMNVAPQKLDDGTEYKNSTEVLEFDCNGQKSWFHGVAYEMNSKLVGIKKNPNAEGFRFMPPMTLGGAIEEAACAYFARKGLH